MFVAEYSAQVMFVNLNIKYKSITEISVNVLEILERWMDKKWIVIEMIEILN